jgi:peptidoglycan/LPS O-acetylase OafA/YrhL
MQPIPRLYFITAAVFALLGMIWGIVMSATMDHTLSPAHGHLNLIGFVMIAVFGTYYALVPKATEGRLAVIHYGLTVLTVIVMVPGIVLAINEDGEILAKLGSVLAVLTMLIFLYVVVRNRSD